MCVHEREREGGREREVESGREGDIMNDFNDTR